MRRPPFAGTALALALAPAVARAHGEDPRITAITFPAPLAGAPLFVTDTQGVYGTFGEGVRWLCEDAVGPSATITAMVPTAAPGGWAVAAQTGVHFTTDGGCTYQPARGLPAGAVPLGLWPHPERPDEVLTALGEGSGGAGLPVYRSMDGGRTFAAAAMGPGGPALAHSVFRAPDAPEVVYLSGDTGLARSDDGGLTFGPIALSLPGETIAPGAVYFLAGRPGTGEIWAAVQRVPDSLLVRSADRGETWRLVGRLPDPVASLVFDETGERGRLATLFGSFGRSEDAGESWILGPATQAGLGCLTRGPDAALWACADAYQGAAWTVARSEDFGTTFTPVLSAFQTVRHRWDCPADAPATQRCGDVCPGQQPGAECVLCAAGEVCEGAGGGTGDAGSSDAGADGRADAGAEPDAVVVGPSGPAGETGINPGTCAAAPGRGPGAGYGWVPLGTLAPLLRVRRRRRIA